MLSEVDKPDGSKAQFAYDADGNRVSKTVTTSRAFPTTSTVITGNHILASIGEGRLMEWLDAVSRWATGNAFLLAVGWFFALVAIVTLLLQVLTVIVRHRRIFEDAPRKRSLFLHVASIVYLLGGGSSAYLALHYRRIGVLSLPIEIAALSLALVSIFMGGSIGNEAIKLSWLQNAERDAELSRRITERWQMFRAQKRSRQQ